MAVRIRDLEKSLQQIRQALRPGGIFFAILPAMDAVHYLTMLLVDRAPVREGMPLGRGPAKRGRIIAIMRLYNFAFGEFRYEGLEQHFWQPFEVRYRLRRAGFRGLRMTKVLLAWEQFELCRRTPAPAATRRGTGLYKPEQGDVLRHDTVTIAAPNGHCPAWRARAQLARRRPRPAVTGPHDRADWCRRFRQKQPGFRHPVCRGPASLLAELLGIDPAIPGAARQARGRPDRFSAAGHRRRPAASRCLAAGTLTELVEYLRLLLARVGTVYCLRCGQVIRGLDAGCARRSNSWHQARGWHRLPQRADSSS